MHRREDTPYNLRGLLDHSVEEVQRAVTAQGWPFRVCVRDGNHLTVTLDYNPSRINVETKNGIVVAAWLG